jgi:cytochrome c biogenesis protein CcmG, thiol:disulfide interchange protein DsbE
MRRPLVLAALLACAGACAAAKPARPPAPSPLVGRPFALASRDLAGGEVRIPADGKVHVVDFWATWCDPCREQLPMLDALAARHRADGLSVVGVAFDDELGAVQAFLAGTPVAFPIVWDPAGEAYSTALGIDRLPTTVVVDRSGVVRSVHLGFEGAGAAALEDELRRLLAE